MIPDFGIVIWSRVEMNKIRTFLSLAIIFLGLNFAISSFAQQQNQLSYNRIISILPSVTETIFALGAEDKLVGVSQYCLYPLEARSKKIVGGLVDLNLETVYALNPDLIILPTKVDTYTKQLNKMGIEVFRYETRSVKGILSSVRILGEKLNRERQAQELITTMENKIADIQSQIKNLPKPRVLVSYLRPIGEGKISEVYIAGNHTYFNDLINIIGGVNAYQGPQMITSPLISPEGILQMDPDIILDMMTMLHKTSMSESDVKKDWDMLSDLKAYKSKKIYVLSQPFIGIPGPRLVKTLDILARIIHPEVNWDTDEK